MPIISRPQTQTLEMPLVPLNNPDQGEFAPLKIHHFVLRMSKRAVDILAAVTFFVLFGWLCFLVAMGVFLSSGKPILYSQTRVGKNGKKFHFFKFRSMVSNASHVLEQHFIDHPEARKEWADFQKLQNDPRITKFGAFIRKTSLDELPQFWNILIGDMSLVGPRPCMPNQQGLYGDAWHYYTAIRPGLTGLWQVSGRNTLSFRERVYLDVQYVQTLSIWTDIKIFVRTVWVVATGHGSR